MRLNPFKLAAIIIVVLAIGGVQHKLRAQSGPQPPGPIGNAWGTNGAHVYAGGAQPTISSGCGTNPGTVAGSDTAGHFVTGTGTAQPCVITFGQVYAKRPTCIVTGEASTVSYNTTPTAINITSLVDSERIYWNCVAQPNGG